MNISDNSMKKSFMKPVADSIVKGYKNGSKLKTLIWNYDPSQSPTTAKNFLLEIGKLGKINLKELSICGVFQQKDMRSGLISQFRMKGIKLILFEPSFTDESSPDYTDDDS